MPVGAAELPELKITFGTDALPFRGFATRDPDGHPVVVASIEGPASYDSGATVA